MKRKTFKKISTFLAVAGFIWILGTAGTADLNLIDFETTLIRYFIGVALMGVGGVGLELCNDN